MNLDFKYNLSYSVRSEIIEFKPCLKFLKNRFQLSASLNLEKFWVEFRVLKTSSCSQQDPKLSKTILDVVFNRKFLKFTS